MGKIPSFDGDSGAHGFGRHGRGPGRGSGGIGHGPGRGSDVHGSGTSSAVPITYQLGDTPNTPDEYPNANKILIGVAPEIIARFQPSTATKMNQIFKNKVQEEGSNWTKVTPEMKDNYWEEFKKHFIWARGAEEEVKQCWKKTAGRLYRNFIND